MELRRYALGAAAVLLASGCASESGPAPAGPSLSSTSTAAAGTVSIPGQYIVVFKRDVQDAPGLARKLVQENGGRMRFLYARALKGFSAQLTDAAIARLRQNPNIAYIEPNQVVSLATDQSNPPSWGLDRVDQRDRPLDSKYSYSTTASNVTAYIIDTGILTSHSEFGGRASIGADEIGDGQNGIDCNGHGTHVSGTVGGSTYGLAKGVKLVGVRVLDCGGSGSTDGVIAGIDWVTANAHLPAVANMSLGGGASQSLNDAVTASINAGVTYAIAAGNGNFFGRPVDACSQSPASTPNAITVGATDINDHEASFSNYGTCVDIMAPGVNITSSWIGSDNATNTISGTSMATPHVAGAAALWLADHPNDTPAQVTSALKSNGSTGKLTLNSNKGQPNLLLFTGSSDNPPPPPPPPGNNPPSASFSVSCSSTSCTATNTSTDPDGASDIASSKFDWGDGTSTTVSGAGNASHDYSRAGSYTVKLTVTDNAGATGTSSQSVRVRRFR